MSRSAVLLMAFGGPETEEQVAPFMTRLMGRPPAPPVLARVVERYRIIGGGSPLPRIAREQAAALERQLASEGAPSVRVAFMYSDPSIPSAIQALAAAGVQRVVGVSLSAHYARVSSGAYAIDLAAAGQKHGVEVRMAGQYHAAPCFLDGLAESARAALDRLSAPDDTEVIFSAHSLPLEHVEGGDPYVDQIGETMAGVMARLPQLTWQLAYQSRGMTGDRWLGPTVEETLEELSARGRKRVLLIPVGFTAEHVETLYDIDVLIAGKAREMGLEFVRAAALNSSPYLIEALAAVVRPHLLKTSEGETCP
ncbi:MAG: ferrochelatase [Chloroflexota bacterium]|nr:MAG: ferrochelatase [Chloroflexota bacterium]